MKRGRKAPSSKRSTKRAKTVSVVPVNVAFPGPGRQQQYFVPRSFGNPRAITERKYYTASRNGLALTDLTTNDDWTGTEADIATTNCLFAPVTGDDFNNRDGRKVQVIAIKIRGFVEADAQTNQTTADQSCMIRMLLLVDKQTNATQFNGEDVLSGQTNTRCINAFQNPAFFGRFKVLKDKQFILQNPSMTFDGTNVEQSGVRRMFKITHKFRKPMVVHFNATNGGTVADIIDNSFHIMAGYDQGGLNPSLTYTVRTTFIDV